MQTALIFFLAAAMTTQSITPREREFAMKRLQDSRKLFLDSIKGLTEAQWTFQPGADRWSVAGCAEHIVVTEEAYLRSLTRLLEAPPSNRKAELTDKELLRLYTDRSLKRTAGEALQPHGRWASRAELIEEFNRTRDRIIALAETTQLPLRSYSSPAAAGGKVMDAYQWFLRIAGHVERHTAQIEEVKSHPNFPRAK